MGRAKGEAARAKSRPSSSSMAASLLPSGVTAVGFGGYVGSSRVDSSLASAPDASPFLDIDGEVAQHLKRLSRKDPTTKLKALASLSQLIKQKSAKEIAKIIPQWAFEYKKLLLDYNREVRRATHDTMTNLVVAVGRDLAPHLKPLIGPWWFSQFDSIYEVSQAAKRSFQTAFPAQERRVDALMLYSAEIFTYIEENLKLTPQSLSDKETPSDELEEMHQQVLSSSLLALAALLDVFFSWHSDSSATENVTGESKHVVKARTIAASAAEKLFSSHKYFLDFLKSQSPAIRSAAYSVVRSCIKNIPHAISEGDIKVLAGTILGSFQEKNPACHSSMWDTFLLFTKSFPESWHAVNVQKTILSRLWNFLRNGCFGSQQVSYPALVLFLEIVPSEAITGDKFFLEFFHSLWAGRSMSYSSNADRLAFFLAVEECFIWGLRNSSRYCEGVEAIYHFQHTLINEILLGLLWHEYLLAISPKYQEASFSSCTQGESKNCIQNIHKEPREAVNSKHSMEYEETLGKCIIKILSQIHCLKHDLLSAFSLKFQADCLDIFQETEYSSQNVLWVVKFIFLLDKYAVQKGETWPLLDLVGPALKKSFPLIETLDSPDAVRLIVVAVTVFGPRKIIQELMCTGVGTRQFLQSFTDIIIPWCLKSFTPSTATRLDLLLALLDDECFSQQWNAIITYLVNRKKVGFNPGTVNGDQISVLAILMEKVRERTRKSISRSGSCERNWQHELLDLVAIDVVKASPPFGNSDARFLCAVVGGEFEDDKVCFLSRNTLTFVFEEVLRRLMTFMVDSPFAWVQDVFSLLISGRSYSEWRLESSSNLLDMAHFALDILNGSYFCLNTIEAEGELVQGILATIFIIDWEFSWINVSEPKLDEHIGKAQARLTFCEAVHAFRCKITDQFLKSFSVNSRKSLATTLIQSIKCIAFVDYRFDSDNFISSCCQWAIGTFEIFCQDEVEEQHLLEQLLSKNDSWPLWIMPDTAGARLQTENMDLQAPKNTKFIALVDKLISEIGFGRVVAGVISKASLSSTKDPVVDLIYQSHYSRPWLAAEMLCTWKWLGGSVLHSFLPSFLGYVKKGDYGFADSIFNILLDGSLVHGARGGLNLLNCASVGELEAVEEPFLRALLSILCTLFQNNVWGNEKARSLFRLLLDKLYIGDTANLNCLRVLPSILNILVRPLSTGFDDHTNDHCDPYSQSELHQVTVDWLKRTASFPPLNAWQTGEDMEDWLQLVISCFPIEVTGRMQRIRPERTILPMEREVLYELFQKQRQGASAVVNKLPLVQKLLSELMVISVAYCWEDFEEDDWKFVLHRLRFWIEAAVVMMEDIVENVNDTLTNGRNDVNASLNKLENAVVISDPFAIELARNALVGFSLFCSLVGLQDKEHSENLNPLGNEKWAFITDRIFEGILRLFFCTACAEAIANSCCHQASSIIASSRLYHRQFWELVASCVVESSAHARDKAMRSIEIWGLSKGAISSLYALVFSCKPLPPLQYTAFVLLSTEPVGQLAFTCDTEVFNDGASNNEDSLDTLSAENVHLRNEISYKLEKLPHEVLEMDLVAHERVNVLVAWCLLLSHIVSLPSSSPARERMIQYVQDSTNTTILDCLFQHIPLEVYMGTSSRKKDLELPAAVSEAAEAARRAITTGSVLFSVELLWPTGPEKMASLAGAVFGLMLHNLPAYVRGWFSDIRDRSLSSAIESFTKAWCSPTLISNELSEIKKASFADDNFSVSVSKSANEVVATYTKDETGMDLVIRLPPSYPLRPVDVDCTRSLGISEVKRRKWLMSLMSFVRNQNGALAEAIRIWKSNFDKEFEGVEECPICYSVIHTVNHSLPRLACKTCKHKFHSACLYKWFSTSHKSTCPLCQSPF
ncbi:UNVERIFIED_CONTAM: E3 ubiquitin-protein ligase listerin [Sesamum angustifolium]|uniref:E3 ubiquitin-protein ligase listerin n=1 Tax=Sesamum angustifolium TaxID=2727405 RepID=A0AAW2QSI0_9LAMI